jgi:hypothetical protein
MSYAEIGKTLKISKGSAFKACKAEAPGLVGLRVHVYTSSPLGQVEQTICFVPSGGKHLL